MNARNKKSKNTAYKNRKNKLAAEEISLDTSSSEKDVVTAIRRDIKIGKEDLLKDAYGVAGLEEYLVGSHFEQLALIDDKYNEIGKKYHQRSCEKGHPLGQYATALTYLQGSLGQSKDESLGVEIMSRAAKVGCGPALYNKGVWLMDGTFMQPKDFEKSRRIFHKALKDPVIKDFPFQHSRSLVRLGMLRMNGDGCNKSYSAALGHFRAAQVVEPSDFITERIKQLEILEKIGGVEVQREADNRYRRFKVLMRDVQYQTLGEWIALYRHCGFDWSVQPNQEETGVSLDHDDFVEWMEGAKGIQSMPENYPSMYEPLPPLECERPGCLVTENVTGKKMKKCTECQAPYCGVDCQRQDWPRHKPICNAVKGGIDAELTPHNIKLLNQDDYDNLEEKLSKMGISSEEIEKVKSDLKSLGDDCSSDPSNSSIPSSFEGYLEKGPGSMSRHGYTLVTTEGQASAAGGLSRSEDGNVASKVAQGQSSGNNERKALRKQLAKLQENPGITYCLFTPSNINADMGITLADTMGQIMFKMTWNKLIKLPWGAKSRLLWVAYEFLQGNVEDKLRKTMLRNQVMAEFGADPLECKNAEFEEVTENEVRDAIEML